MISPVRRKAMSEVGPSFLVRRSQLVVLAGELLLNFDFPQQNLPPLLLPISSLIPLVFFLHLLLNFENGLLNLSFGRGELRSQCLLRCGEHHSKGYCPEDSYREKGKDQHVRDVQHYLGRFHNIWRPPCCRADYRLRVLCFVGSL